MATNRIGRYMAREARARHEPSEADLQRGVRRPLSQEEQFASNRDRFKRVPTNPRETVFEETPRQHDLAQEVFVLSDPTALHGLGTIAGQETPADPELKNLLEWRNKLTGKRIAEPPREHRRSLDRERNFSDAIKLVVLQYVKEALAEKGFQVIAGSVHELANQNLSFVIKKRTKPGEREQVIGVKINFHAEGGDMVQIPHNRETMQIAGLDGSDASKTFRITGMTLDIDHVRWAAVTERIIQSVKSGKPVRVADTSQELRRFQTTLPATLAMAA